MSTKIKYVIGIIILLIGGMFLFNAFLKDEYVEPVVIDVEEIAEPLKNSIVVPRQAVLEEVYVEKVTFAEGGFVVIYREVEVDEVEMSEDSIDVVDEEVVDDTEMLETEADLAMPEIDMTDASREIIAVSKLYTAGEYTNELVSLHEDAVAEEGESLNAAIYLDNGDGVFDEAVDAPAQGGFASVMFSVVSQGELEDETKL